MPDHQVLRREPAGDSRIERHEAERVLRRAGFPEEYITEVLAGIAFPVLKSSVAHRGAKFGISTESLMEQLGGSP
jgi:hypothetical protein